MQNNDRKRSGPRIEAWVTPEKRNEKFRERQTTFCSIGNFHKMLACVYYILYKSVKDTIRRACFIPLLIVTLQSYFVIRIIFS